ncbi:MAG TPA: hypothetical protein VMW27_07005 [Thermoanaerobaculia bacterium]|nr:hypothetical protein [Thermoanaerobaculia bacterium]
MQGQFVGHQVVTPLHVTCPCSPLAQLRSADEQLVVLVLLLHETVPDAQVAVAVQRAFSWPAAARRTPLDRGAQEPAAPG